MNPFLLRPRERLADWKNFRKAIGQSGIEDQISAVAQYRLATIRSFMQVQHLSMQRPDPVVEAAARQFRSTSMASAGSRETNNR